MLLLMMFLTLNVVGSLLAITCVFQFVSSLVNAEWKRAFFYVSAFEGLVLIDLSIVPGRLESIISELPLMLIGMPIFLAWLAMPFAIAFHDLLVRIICDSSSKKAKWGIRSAGLVLFMACLCGSQITTGIVFSLYENSFQGLLNNASDSRDFSVSSNLEIGPYTVDNYCKDSRGGVYFRTATGQDGIGPDRNSYGFAFRPNSKGSPYGNAYYSIQQIYGDWFVFSASNDW